MVYRAMMNILQWTVCMDLMSKESFRLNYAMKNTVRYYHDDYYATTILKEKLKLYNETL